MGGTVTHIYGRRWASGPVLSAICAAAGLEAVPPSIYRHQPIGGPRGAKVLVVNRQPLRKVGEIYLPPSSQENETDGWILAASHDAGGAIYPFADLTNDELPDLLGLHVAWGRFVGTVLKAKDMADEWDGRFLLMLEADLLTVMGHVLDDAPASQPEPQGA